MNLINLESHVFSSRKLSIKAEDLGRFIPEFLNLHIYPQEFNEGFPNGDLKKQFMFVNPMEGKQIMFQENRISFSLNFPNKKIDSESLKKETNDFIVFIGNVLDKIKSIGRDVDFNRLSYVVRYANMDDVEREVNELRNKTLTTLNWFDNEKDVGDLNIQYGFRDFVDSNEINSVVKLSLGYYSVITSSNNVANKCIIKEVDINTIDENKDDRFDHENTKEFIRKLSDISHERVKSLESF